MNEATMLTGNGYLLCDDHANDWLDRGFAGGMWPLTDDLAFMVGTPCRECIDHDGGMDGTAQL